MEHTFFNDILKHIYELEGLVLVARRDGTDLEILLQMMRDKTAEIGAALDVESAETTESNVEESQKAAATTPVEQEPAAFQAEATVQAEPTSAVSGQMPYDEPPLAEVTVETPAPNEEDKEAEEEIASPILTEVEDDGSSQHDCPEEPAAEMTFDYVEPPKVAIEEKEQQEEYEPATIDDKEETATEETYPLPAPDNINDTPAAVTVDEALQRNMSRDLKKAFTINDRFRYRRELFGNSDIEMNDALNLVEAMQSYAEAEEYFYDMLNWDKQSPEVTDFMAIIRNHFYAK